MATSTVVLEQPKRTTKGGVDLDSFEDVLLYKDVPVVAEVKDINDALGRLGNDHKKLLGIIRDGLQQEAINSARDANEGWKVMDSETRKPTEVAFGGTLANAEIVNPTVLMFAKNNFGYDEIDGKDPKSAEKKREAKQAAKDLIKSLPVVLEGLKKRSAALNAQGE